MTSFKRLPAIAASLAAILVVFLMATWPPFSLGDQVSAIRVGVLPGEAPAELERRYGPLLKHLSEQTGLRYELVVPASYTDLLDMFGSGKLELAHFGGFTFVTASAKHGARPLVMRDIDARFTTYFVARGDGPLATCIGLTCADLAGSVLSFGSRLSTSGHLMPRHFLKLEKGIEPETFFGEVRYSGAHDKTIYDTREGTVDVGAVSAEIYGTMRRDGRLRQGELEVIWETPPYPNYVWAVSARVSYDVRRDLLDAYLMLDRRDAEDRRILSRLGAESFIPAGTMDFEPLRQVAESLGLHSAETP